MKGLVKKAVTRARARKSGKKVAKRMGGSVAKSSMKGTRGVIGRAVAKAATAKKKGPTKLRPAKRRANTATRKPRARRMGIRGGTARR